MFECFDRPHTMPKRAIHKPITLRPAPRQTDFLTLFNETAWLLDADPTIWCISSWVRCVDVGIWSGRHRVNPLQREFYKIKSHPFLRLLISLQNDNGVKTEHQWNATRLVGQGVVGGVSGGQ